MKLTQNFLFITYYLKRIKNELEVTFRGCREIACFDYELPPYVKGMVEIEGEYIWVIDPNVYFHGRQSLVGNLACILVIEYVYEYRNCRAGVIVEDHDDILNLLACNYREITSVPFTFNMNFIVNVLKEGPAKQFLSNTQKLFDIHEKRNSVIRHYVEKNHSVNIKVEDIELDEFEIFNNNEFLVTI